MSELPRFIFFQEPPKLRSSTMDALVMELPSKRGSGISTTMICLDTVCAMAVYSLRAACLDLGPYMRRIELVDRYERALIAELRMMATYLDYVRRDSADMVEMKALLREINGVITDKNVPLMRRVEIMAHWLKTGEVMVSGVSPSYAPPDQLEITLEGGDQSSLVAGVMEAVVLR